MIHYVLPGTGIYGGIKVGFQFAALLDSLGVAITVATPDGSSPDWLTCRVPVCSHDEALAPATGDGPLMFSLPHDHERLRCTGRQLWFHCQGTDPAIDSVLDDEEVRVLTCWDQAREYAVARGRQPVEVGIAVSDVFHRRRGPRLGHVVACMPRRGGELIRRARRDAPGLVFVEIDGLHEHDVAAVLASASFYLSTTPREYFGLPSLEAMSAGCVVVSPPVVWEPEYLVDGYNARVVDPANLGSTLRRLAEGDPAVPFALRNAALVTAARYRLAVQRRRLRRLLGGPLVELAT